MSIRIATREESLHDHYMRGWRYGASVDSSSVLALVAKADPGESSMSAELREFVTEEKRGYDDGLKARQAVSKEARERYGVRSRT